MIKNKPQPHLPQSRDPVIPVHQRKIVGTLNANDCRWPIGDPQKPDFHFCGKPKTARLPLLRGSRASRFCARAAKEFASVYSGRGRVDFLSRGRPLGRAWLSGVRKQ